MPVLFSCECGKRLKTPDHLAGKAIRCPQCGERVLVPARPIATQENDSPFVIDDTPSDLETRGEPTAAEPSVAPSDPLAFPWLTAAASQPEPAAATANIFEAIVAHAPRGPAPAAEFVSSETEPPDTEPAADWVVPEVEPLRPATAAYRGRDAHMLPPGLREPWYIAWVEAFANGLRFAAILTLVIVPATTLGAGLIALARKGDPKAALELQIAGVRILPAMLWSAAGILAAAIFWAAPFLLIVDLWRRYRAMSVRLDAFLNPRTKSSPTEQPDAGKPASPPDEGD